jgi:protein-S-isoprenylcysteine O-methyltransferase Ste14
MRRPTAAVGSALFFVLAPGVVVGLIPWLLTRWQARTPLPYYYWAPVRVIGMIVLVAGVIVLVGAFARFVMEGLGTPAPVAAPERLVVGGVYRYVRNPMYVAILAAIVGQAFILGRLALLLYATVLWLITAAFVRFYEEPTLARRFGADYEAYRRAVPAWWPRLRPWDPGERGEPRAR